MGAGSYKMSLPWDKLVPLVFCTDCKSVYDCVKKEGDNIGDNGNNLDVIVLRQLCMLKSTEEQITICYKKRAWQFAVDPHTTSMCGWSDKIRVDLYYAKGVWRMKSHISSIVKQIYTNQNLFYVNIKIAALACLTCAFEGSFIKIIITIKFEAFSRNKNISRELFLGHNMNP